MSICERNQTRCAFVHISLMAISIATKQLASSVELFAATHIHIQISPFSMSFFKFAGLILLCGFARICVALQFVVPAKYYFTSVAKCDA